MLMTRHPQIGALMNADNRDVKRVPCYECGDTVLIPNKKVTGSSRVWCPSCGATLILGQRKSWTEMDLMRLQAESYKK